MGLPVYWKVARAFTGRDHASLRAFGCGPAPARGGYDRRNDRRGDETEGTGAGDPVAAGLIMSVSASRRAWWSRQELLAWVLHRRNSAVDNVEKVEAEKGSSLIQSMEAGLAAYYATFARRGPGKIPTPGRVLAAHRLLKCAEASGKISANRAGRFSSKVARDLWEGSDAGKTAVVASSPKRCFSSGCRDCRNATTHRGMKSAGQRT